MSDSPFLWYLNRATGSVLMVLFTLVVVLGLLATFGRAGRGPRVPRFVTQALHRQVTLVAVALLAGHVATAVLDTFVDIRWWQAVVPFGASYKPLWLGLGAVSLDLIALVVVTSLARTRLGHRSWRTVHVLGYAAWASALVHGYGIGTDSGQTWSRELTLGCAALVVVVGLARVVSLVRTRRLQEAR